MKMCLMLAPALVILLLIGCSEKETTGRVQATGSVNYKGQPVEGASVILSPEGGAAPAATGKTDGSGQFTLSTSAGDGVVPGKYKVMVSKTETTTEEIPESDPRYGSVTPKTTVKDHLPARYKDPAKSGLTVEIRDGEDNVLPPFELTD